MPIIIPKAQSLKPKAKSIAINRWKRYFAACASGLFLMVGFSQPGSTQSNLIPPPPATCELDLALLKSADTNKDRNIVTADTVSASGTTTPSLWWTSEQFPPKLVTNWIANGNQKQIYLLVNTQSWNSLDYIDRYRTVDRFGHAARSYGYNLKVCNGQKIALAEYSCDSKIEIQSQQVLSQNNNCQILLNTTGQTGLGIQSK